MAPNKISNNFQEPPAPAQCVYSWQTWLSGIICTSSSVPHHQTTLPSRTIIQAPTSFSYRINIIHSTNIRAWSILIPYYWNNLPLAIRYATAVTRHLHLQIIAENTYVPTGISSYALICISITTIIYCYYSFMISMIVFFFLLIDIFIFLFTFLLLWRMIAPAQLVIKIN